MTDSVILTGGYRFKVIQAGFISLPIDWRSRSVQEYNLQGSVARLPDLNIGRRLHACGHYVHQGQIVSTEL